MSSGPEKTPPPVDLELPIVQELIEEYGNRTVSYQTSEGEQRSSVANAFNECGDLSEIGRQNPSVLRMIIEDSVSNHQSEGN